MRDPKTLPLVLSRVACLMGGAVMAMAQLASAQANLTVPKQIQAGDSFSIHTSGSGNATLYIIGIGNLVKRTVQLGEQTEFASGSLFNAGRYLAILANGSSATTVSFDVLPAGKPADVSFLAKPSRLQVGLHDGITGAVYLFDAYSNLVTAPTTVSFELSTPTGAIQKREVKTHEGAAWTAMDSTAQQGADKFVARVGDIASTRVIRQVPGDPCGLKMSAHPQGQHLQVVTEPVKDCNGNAVPDGTIVTFTETFKGGESTVDVPLKRGIAEVQMPATDGATITVASGVVLGNQIRWGK